MSQGKDFLASDATQSPSNPIPSDLDWRALLSHVPGMLYRSGHAPNWPLLFASDGCLPLTGHDPMELVENKSTNYYQLIHPQDRDHVLHEVQHALVRHQSFQLHYRIITRTGQEKWVWDRGTGIFDNHGHLLYVQGFVTDISTQKRIEQALEESEANYRNLFEHATEGFFRSTPDGRITMANPAAARILGYSTPEAMIDNVHNVATDMYPSPAQRDAWIQQIREQGSVVGYLSEIQTCDGRRLWLSENSRGVFSEDGELLYIEGTIEDITEQVEASQALRESEERYTRAILGANDGLWDWNLRSGEVYFSPRWKQQIGYTDNEIGSELGEWLSRVHPDDAAALSHVIDAHLAGETPHFEIEHRLQHKSGEYRWMLVRGIRTQSESSNVEYLSGSQTDISSRKEVEEILQHAALHDELTGLPNRTLFIDRLNQAIRQRSRYSTRTYAVLYIDLDRFKLVNDSLGHTPGDTLLKLIASRISEELRETDTLARLGGDEFVVLLEQIHNVHEACEKAEKLCALLRQPFRVGQQDLYVAASIGIVLGTNFYTRPDDVLRDADNAMYQAKRLGRSRAVVFDQGMRQRAVARLRMETDLRKAVDGETILPFYQPIISLHNRGILGFEALARWLHPRRGILGPEEFIPIAEDTGLILDLGERVLIQACHQIRQWKEKGHNLTLSVNLSARQLAYPGMVSRIEDTLNETGMSADMLKLEITESAILENLDSVFVTLHKLKELGIHLIMDDFGTGYSSLQYLHRFPFDGLKVDASFIHQLPGNQETLQIIHAIFNLCENLHLDAIPEGIESEQQETLLRDIGFVAGQGFYYSKPLSAEDAAAYIG